MKESKDAEEVKPDFEELATTSPILAAKLARLPAEQAAMIFAERPTEGWIGAARTGTPGS